MSIYYNLTFFISTLLSPSLVFLLPSMAEAKVFKNSYISFELPQNWDCNLDQSAWICNYKVPGQCQGPRANSKVCKQARKKPGEALIVLAAKEAGPKDSLAEYYKHIKKPRPIVLRGGRKTQSKVMHAKQSKINGQVWVDAMHFSSELPNYYTRYFSTTSGSVAVLVTFTAHKLHYTKYSKQFFRAIRSLRVLTKTLPIAKLNQQPGEAPAFGRNPDIPVIDQGEDTLPEPDNSSGIFLFIALLAALGGGYFWWKSRRA